MKAGIGRREWSLFSGTPLHRAAELGNVEAIRILCNSGADPNARQLFVSSQTPLLRAVAKCPEEKASETIFTLVCLGADPKMRCNGKTPYQKAKKLKRHAATAILKGKRIILFSAFLSLLELSKEY